MLATSASAGDADFVVFRATASVAAVVVIVGLELVEAGVVEIVMAGGVAESEISDDSACRAGIAGPPWH